MPLMFWCEYLFRVRYLVEYSFDSAVEPGVVGTVRERDHLLWIEEVLFFLVTDVLLFVQIVE